MRLAVRHFPIALGLALLVLTCSGCAGIRDDYPVRTTFRLAARAAGTAPEKLDAGRPLLVAQLGISPEFESDAFVYRTGESRFRSDFYHSFVAPPARMITDILAENLYASDRFMPARGNFPAQTRYQLSGKILDLYADLRNSPPYRAVISLRLTLDADTSGNFAPLIHQIYREEIPFDTLDPDLYVSSLNQGLTRILDHFFSDLPAAPLPAAPPAKETQP